MTQLGFRKDILLAAKGKQIHRQLKTSPNKAHNLGSLSDQQARPDLLANTWNKHSLQKQGVSSHKGWEQKRDWDKAFWANIFFVVIDYESESRAEGRSQWVVRQTWSGGGTEQGQ